MYGMVFTSLPRFHCTRPYLVQGRSQKWPKEGVLRPKIAKGGVLRVRKSGGYAPECRFSRVLVKMTRKFEPRGRGVLTPTSPPLGYAPDLVQM